MPRTRKPRPNSHVASAARVNSARSVGVPRDNTSAAWQADAWDMLDAVGELEFYREWYANAGSRIDLYVQYEDAEGNKHRVDGETPVGPADALALAALGELFGGEDGQSQMMSSFFSLLSIPGEAWLVGILIDQDTADAPDKWRVVAKEEIKEEGGRWIIDRGDGRPESYRKGKPATPTSPGEDPEVYVARIWRPHPRKWAEATSSVRSALPVLRKIVGLDKKTSADVDSRLAGAGVLLVPTEATFNAPVQGAHPTDPASDPFIDSLIETATAAMSDRSDPASVVPGIARMPGQYIKDVRHVTFWSEFSKGVGDLEERSLRRLATALDVPAEVLMGLADVNHWTGWLIDDNAIKMHIEPNAEVVTHGLTTQYLYPVFQAASSAGVLDPALRRYTIEADTSQLRQRPNLTAQAESAHASITITDAAYAREVGFAEGDLIDLENPLHAAEYQRRVLMQVAQGSNQTLALAALATLGAPIDPALVEALTPAAPGPGAGGMPAAPETPAIESRTPPDAAGPANPAAGASVAASGGPNDPWRVALVLGCEGIVFRAMERAHNRAGKRRGGRKAIPADQIDACLDGAWERVPRVAAMTGVEPDVLLRALDSYTRAVLVAGIDHDPHALAQTLDRMLTGETLAS